MILHCQLLHHKILSTPSISSSLSVSRKSSSERSKIMRRLEEIYNETEIIDGNNLFYLHLNQELLTVEEAIEKAVW